MEQFMTLVEGQGLTFAFVVVLAIVVYKFFMRVYDEQRQDKKEADEQYDKREQEFMKQLSDFNNTLVQVNETSKEIAISNKMLVGSMKDDISDLKHDMEYIKDKVDSNTQEPTNNPIF